MKWKQKQWISIDERTEHCRLKCFPSKEMRKRKAMGNFFFVFVGKKTWNEKVCSEIEFIFSKLVKIITNGKVMKKFVCVWKWNVETSAMWC